MSVLLCVAVLGFVGLCWRTLGFRQPLGLERSGIFLFSTSLLIALFFGAFRLTHQPPELGALAKMLGEANYAFLILFLRWLRKGLPRPVEIRGSWLVVLVSLIHLMLNLMLTGSSQMTIMSVQVLVLIGWVALEAWWLWSAQPHWPKLLLALVVTVHWLAELAVRGLMGWQLWQGGLGQLPPGWTDMALDWMWVTFFLGFMAQLAIAAVLVQALRQDKERLEQLVQGIEGLLKEKESLIMTLLGSNAARQSDPHLATIAHELRQPLSSIQLNAEYLVSGQRLSKDEELQVLNDILHDNRRAVSIVQGLRTLFGDSGSGQVSLALSHWLQNWGSRQSLTLHQQFGVVLVVQCPDAEIRVMAAPEQLEMVLHNLVNNAVEAMAGQSVRRLQVSLSAQNRLVMIDVIDNGPGVAGAIRERIFEMRFSTKSQGMGVGLWLCQRIAHQHGGHLACMAMNTGAHMRLTLPMAPP